MFTDGAKNLIGAVFSGTWGLFQITIPGTTVTFGAFALGCIGTVIAIRLFTFFFNTGVGFASSVGGNNHNIKVSKDRSGDDK